VNEVKKEMVRERIRLSAKKALAKLEKESEAIIFKNLQQMIPQLLGFERDGWNKGNWKVDHCNGRAGESLVGNLLKKKVHADAAAWIDKQQWFGFDEKQIEAMKNDYKSTFYHRVSELLRRDVDEKATIYVENLITEITQEIASEITE